MSDIDVTIATHIMGWGSVHTNKYGELYAETPESAPGRTRCPLFTESLDACHQVEKRLIELGLDGAYLTALYNEVGNGGIFLMRLIAATPEQRCRAMLKALDARP
ncbi:hypothetical protein [Deinococcus wulumuqiensis]|uniref:Uncharacterized protein n=1 Tax=Deinococcus wulumuqiensis TaxID=980427 RepID=A0AAV4KAS6_9DEIO|nr:hypothetical protein [Deinococcus wulumuqiensis]QII20088.1 hypothetical protein G6R31_04385 [Deinococcus wulumuqiensis R12]GGI95275.1 hypothetical protein GCM10010914_32180 [Deinococcus wulumuqiensis]GGP30024.1 hypothetical protein GCM10008021_16750 [Deinococcus wulumuqiensis]